METKPGYKTTEFWSAVILALGTIIASASSVLPAKYAALASAIVAGLYAVGRGIAKANVKPDPGA